MNDVDWDEAAVQWELLVREQESMSSHLSFGDKVKAITFFMFSVAWFVRTVVLLDSWAISFALGTVISFLLITVWCPE